MINSFYKLPLKKLQLLLSEIIDRKFLIIAPQKTDLTRFLPLTDPKNINFTEQSYFPIKDIFFKPQEIILEYKNQKIKIPKIKSIKQVLFGLRRCDLNAIQKQDLVFMNKNHPDPAYTTRRKNTILIGYHCITASHQYCFCGSMDLKDEYDIMFFPRKTFYLIHVKTKNGQKFINKFKKLLTQIDYILKKKDIITPQTDILKKKDISKLYNHPDWQKGVDLCLSCTACTSLCPTCYCHEIHDYPDITKIGCGKRCREWSSCQIKSFTKVAGNHIFREKRLERFKHRIYHQLQYFKEQNDVNLCIGCGRCILGCPTRIDFVKLINNMKPLKKKPKKKNINITSKC